MDHEKMEQFEQAIAHAYNGDVEFKVLAETTAMDPGKCALTFHPWDKVDWKSILLLCAEADIPAPDNMLVEKVPGHFCAVTLFWGLDG